MGPTYSSGRNDQGAGRVEGEVLCYPGVAFVVGDEADRGKSTRPGSTQTQLKLGIELKGSLVVVSDFELSRIVVTPLPSPAGVSIDQAWLHPVLPDNPAVGQGDIKEVQIKVTPFLGCSSQDQRG